MRSSDNQLLTAQEDRKQISCICSGERVNDPSVCAPAPVHCPHPCCHWKWSTVSTAVGAGSTGRQGGTWVTHWVTRVHQDVAVGMTVSHDREIPALRGISHASWGTRETQHIHALFLQFCITNLSSLAVKGAKILC